MFVPELYILKDKLALPSAVIEKTAYIYRKVQESGFVRGRTIPAVLVAVVYLVYREMGISRTLKVINKTRSWIYRLPVFALDLKIPLVDPMKCIAKVANNANLSESTRRKAMSIMKEGKIHNIPGFSYKKEDSILKVQSLRKDRADTY